MIAKSALIRILSYTWHRKEALIWLAALVYLAAGDPHQHHYTLCPLSNLGFDYCPGCGLGRSIMHAFHLNLKASFLCHPLGIPAIILIALRIARVIRHKEPEKLILNLN